MEATKRLEVEELQKRLTALPQWSGKLIYLSVNKLVNARFFSRLHENPAPGTYIADPTTGHDAFFLISQYVTAGTVSPTKYHVMLNTTNIPNVKIAELAYKLCYLYYNWNGPVKIPVPTFLAHKVAYLVANSIQTLVTDRNLQEVPYYI